MYLNRYVNFRILVSDPVYSLQEASFGAWSHAVANAFGPTQPKLSVFGFSQPKTKRLAASLVNRRHEVIQDHDKRKER